MDWNIVDGSLVKEFEFANFTEAVAFVDAIVPLAERADHHPDLLIHDYKKVTVSLRTHTEDAITDKDYMLAKQIDAL